MKTINLPMNITADKAHAEWESLPASAPKQQRDAYYRRWKCLNLGVTHEKVSYIESGTTAGTAPITASGREETRKAILPATPHLPRTIRPGPPKNAHKPPAQKPQPKEVKSCPSTVTATAGTPSARPAQPAKTNTPGPANPRSRAGLGRVPTIDPKDAPAIHHRISQLAEALGYGDIGINTRPVWGGVSQFGRKAGCNSESTLHDTIRTGKKIWPSVIDGIVKNFGASREWLLTGKGEMLEMAVQGAYYEPRNKHQGAAANWQPLIKRQPGGILFDRLAFNADQTFSILGTAALTSRFSAPNDKHSEPATGRATNTKK